LKLEELQHLGSKGRKISDRIFSNLLNKIDIEIVVMNHSTKANAH